MSSRNIVQNNSRLQENGQSIRFRSRLFFLNLQPAALTFLIYACICRKLDIVPFSPHGDHTLAWQDAYYQYLDFFAWYKDLLRGTQSVRYTFSSALGQEAVGIFAYYLSSPVNLLVLFFDKTRLQEFYNLAVGIKMALSALTMSIYLRGRFGGRTTTKGIILDELSARAGRKKGPARDYREWIFLMLSVSYGLMHYQIAQSGNMMWMDGVYMLPLILLGVHRLLKENSWTLLSLSVMFSVLFNWYTAGINCLAAGIVFVVEIIAGPDQGEAGKRSRPVCLLLSFICAMLAGLCLSAFFFLPVIFNMKQGRGSSFDWSAFKNGLLGNPWNMVNAWTPGEISEEGYPALFCGSAALIGCLGLFALRGEASGRENSGRNLTDGIQRRLWAGVRQKSAFFLLLLCSVLMFYWRPAHFLFSLLKKPHNYWYRYEYVAIFFLLMTAAHFYDALERGGRLHKWLFIMYGAVFAAASLWRDRAVPHEDRSLFRAGLLMTAAALVLVLVLDLTARRATLHVALLAALTALTVGDLTIDALVVAEKLRWDGAKAFAAYNREEIRLTDDVRNYDAGVWRMTQTMTRSMDYQKTTANYNESLAFDYMAVENYTSCPQNIQLDLVRKLGYACYSDSLLAKNTFLQPADTILGVRYLLSPYAVRGLDPVTQIPQGNGKDVYENPCFLPLAFCTDLTADSSFFKKRDSEEDIEEKSEPDNPFLYWNRVYTAFSGIDEPIMQELDYERDKSEDQIRYRIRIPEGSYAVYGNLHHRKYATAKLSLNGRFEIPYSRWQAVRAFYIPADPKDREAEVIYRAEKLNRITQVQFYGLDLDRFDACTRAIRERGASRVSLDRTRVEIEADAEQGQVLFTSIPYDQGWKIKVNGAVKKPLLFENCLMCLPLEAGTNVIRMEYHVPGAAEGLALTIAGAFLLFVRKRYWSLTWWKNSGRNRINRIKRFYRFFLQVRI